ncbi:MAG: aldehyde ferredoxin oxidoreductase family protein [Chloroflexota bacterium]
MTYAWQGQYLEVELATGQTTVQPLQTLRLIETIGGIGLAAELLYRSAPARSGPLEPENPLVLAAGPLSGTTFAGTGRISVAARSPLTGVWGEASIGGYFATQLKRAGYDALVLRGAAVQPSLLLILDGEVQLVPAGDLWGVETYACEQQLIRRYPRSEALCIGPAGERLVPLASLVHKQGNNVAARTGMGAVMGSKRLKAIVARGSQEIALADPPAFQQLKREAIELFNKHDFIQVIRRGGGTAAAAPIAIQMADLTARNWDVEISEWGPELAQAISGPAMQAQFPSQKDTCYACPVACKWTAEAPASSGGGHLAGPEYESLAALGAQVQVSDALAVMQAGDLCNRLGIDTISTGATIAWALEAHQRGLLDPTHIDPDLQLSWGDPALVLELVRRIGENRPGLGALLARGSREAARLNGAGAEFAMQVKGLELPFHHPRALRGLDIAYATLPKGATHNEEGVAWDWPESTYETWVGESIRSMNLSGANSSLVYCQFLAGALNADFTARLLTAATGVTYTPASLQRAGERTWLLRRLFNLRLGVGAEADLLPERVRRQVEQSAASLKDLDAALRVFYQLRGLDARGRPSLQRLSETGLVWLADEIMDIF